MPKPTQTTSSHFAELVCTRVRRLLNAVHMAEIVGFQTI